MLLSSYCNVTHANDIIVQIPNVCAFYYSHISAHIPLSLSFHHNHHNFNRGIHVLLVVFITSAADGETNKSDVICECE